MNQLMLGELLTPPEIARAVEIVKAHTLPHKQLLDFVTPLMPRINERTGQENSAKYFAYLLEGVLRAHIKGAAL